MARLLAPIPLDDLTVSVDDDGEDNAIGESPTNKLQKWQHEKLMRSIARLDKPLSGHRKIQRSEPAKNIGDQDFSVGTRKSLSVSALLKKSDNSQSDKAVKKKLLETSGARILAEPLRKIDALKLQRTVAYEEVSKDLKKWDPVVKANRVAEGVAFPLDETKLQIQTASEYVKRYQTRTPLEMEVEELVNGSGSGNNLTKSTILTKNEKEVLDAMSLKEASFRRQELQKTKALLSYKEQKERWQSKIKSKKFHRFLRKTKKKMEEKSFAELKEKNPEIFLEKLEILEKKRIEERLTLKHRNMGKWARLTAARSKTDKSAREALQEQLRLSRSLAKKAAPLDDEKNNENNEKNEKHEKNFSKKIDVFNETVFDEEAKVNPWMSSGAAKGDDWEDESDIDGKFEDLELEDERKEKEAKKRPPKNFQQKPLPNRSRPPAKNSTKRRRDSSESENEDKKQDEDEDEDGDVTELVEGGEMVLSTPNVQSGTPTGISQQFQKTNIKNSRNVRDVVGDVGEVGDVDVDPSDVIVATRSKVRKTSFPRALEEDVDVDSDEEQRAVVAEAFAEDDIMEEFAREKEAAAEKEKPKDIDLSLPGWGDWAGSGIGVNFAKKRKFLVKAPKNKPRKDRFLPNVFLSERGEEKIIPHLIRELPFPFTKVAQLQSTIRTPVGKMWNTEAAFDEMTKPKYTTKMGVVIRPIDPKTALRKAKRKAREEGEGQGGEGLGGRTALERSVVTVVKKGKPAGGSNENTVKKVKKN